MDFPWQFERPGGLWLLLWILPLVWLLRRRQAPSLQATGTLELWRELLGPGRPRAVQKSQRMPPWAWLWIAGLVAGTLAVTGPRLPRATEAPLYVIQVDRSPSMYLAQKADEGSTRYQRALEMTLAWLEEASVPGHARRWQSFGLEPTRGAKPPAAWAQRPVFPQPELPVHLWQDTNITLMTDRGRGTRAGVMASGGGPVPGWIGERDLRALVWDGEKVLAGPLLEARRVAAGDSLTGDLRELFSIWARQRGLGVSEQTAAAEIVFELEEPTGTSHGKTATAWLDSSTAATESDPAQWAASWAQAFDRALPPRAGVCALAERQAAGDEQAQPGQSQWSAPQPQPIPMSAWLALASLLAGLGVFAWPSAEVKAKGLKKRRRSNELDRQPVR